MGTTWEKQNAPHFEHIAQGEAGTVWGCTAAHEIYFKTKTTDWVVVPRKLSMASCGPHFQVWSCNSCLRNLSTAPASLHSLIWEMVTRRSNSKGTLKKVATWRA
ncbi:hypothetical protein Pelo_18604 [Pelomyxa schiedti]|nr:hypothetical protein Pelo_18604 [Pelomyxa schiedti]